MHIHLSLCSRVGRTLVLFREHSSLSVELICLLLDPAHVFLLAEGSSEVDNRHKVEADALPCRDAAHFQVVAEDVFAVTTIIPAITDQHLKND